MRPGRARAEPAGTVPDGAGKAGMVPDGADRAGMVPDGAGRARLAAGSGIPAAPMEERARNGRERGGDSGGGAALWRAPGRGWCEEPHFNEGRANANHCNPQQQKKGEAAAARAPQQRATARGGVTKAAEPLSAATPAPTAGWSGGGREPPLFGRFPFRAAPSLRARPAGLSEEVPARLRRAGKSRAVPALPRPAPQRGCGVRGAGARSRAGGSGAMHLCPLCAARPPPRVRSECGASAGLRALPCHAVPCPGRLGHPAGLGCLVPPSERWGVSHAVALPQQNKPHRFAKPLPHVSVFPQRARRPPLVTLVVILLLSRPMVCAGSQSHRYVLWVFFFLISMCVFTMEMLTHTCIINNSLTDVRV